MCKKKCCAQAIKDDPKKENDNIFLVIVLSAIIFVSASFAFIHYGINTRMFSYLSSLI